ncbi:MAG: cupin domain-containing protein [Candidatus Marinimicrobia bacterium]|nr:cupin domain-containing protein [Candidatus Neomarinimicrobiota bacterium]
MNSIKVNHNPTPTDLEKMGVFNWPIWTKEISEFPWHYDNYETCYFLEGDAVVTPESGDPICMGKGDLVTFPRGLSCTWKILKGVKKYYNFG